MASYTATVDWRRGADEPFTELNRAHNEVWMPWLADKLTELGLKVHPSVCNFLLIEFPSDPARNADAADKFLLSKGIIGRKMGGYGLPQCLRITIGRDDEMRAVVENLALFMGNA